MLELAISPSSFFISSFLLRGKTKGGEGREKREEDPKYFVLLLLLRIFISLWRGRNSFSFPFSLGGKWRRRGKGPPPPFALPLCSGVGWGGDKCVSEGEEQTEGNRRLEFVGLFSGKKLLFPSWYNFAGPNEVKTGNFADLSKARLGNGEGLGWVGGLGVPRPSPPPPLPPPSKAP